MSEGQNRLCSVSRRAFLLRSGLGLGLLGLGGVCADEQSSLAMNGLDPLTPKPTHLAPRAKRIIQIFLNGGLSHVDSFDPKPMLSKYHGKPLPSPNLITERPTGAAFGSPFRFRRYGQSGLPISEIFAELGDHADDLCVLRSVQADVPNHEPALMLMNCGDNTLPRPSMGSWLTYGLGTENENMPGFVVLISSGVQPNGGRNSYGSGFLPSVYQGVQCRSKGDPVLYASDPKGMPRSLRRASLDALRDLNELQAAELGNPETLTRIAQYELAFRMQASVPELMDISREPKQTLEAYGAEPGAGSFANNCLLARRLVESGVRFVQLFDWGWDFHGTGEGTGLTGGLTEKCASMDKPVSALIKDLKNRGLLDETLIVWGGEFGRTPFREGRTAKSKILGRDHYPDCNSMWMAGGGVQGGMSYGRTDELGFSIAENPVHIHDLQATIMHLLGFDHEKLTYRFQGRDYRLTDVHGQVIKPILA